MSQYRLDGLKIIRNRHLCQRVNNCLKQFRSTNQVLYVYHGSSSEVLRAIAKTGFFEPEMFTDPSKSCQQLDPRYFGCGIYHGFAADCAEKYKKSNEILLSMILPDRSYMVRKGKEKYGGKCEVGYNSHISPESKEIVVFQSAQVLPLFIIQFKRVPDAEVVEEEP